MRYLLFFCLVLPGCTWGVADSNPLLSTSSKSNLQLKAEHVRTCSTLPSLNNGAELDVLDHYKTVILAYKQCAAEKQSLVDLLCHKLFTCSTTESPK